MRASILESLFFILQSRQTLHVCSEIVSGCFCVLLDIVLLKPVYSPNSACVRPDRFRQSGPLTMSLLLNFFADLVDRQTLRVCCQIASGLLKRLYCAFCLFAKRYVAAASAFPEIDLRGNIRELLFWDPLNATKRNTRNGFCVFLTFSRNIKKKQMKYNTFHR